MSKAPNGKRWAKTNARRLFRRVNKHLDRSHIGAKWIYALGYGGWGFSKSTARYEARQVERDERESRD